MISRSMRLNYIYLRFKSLAALGAQRWSIKMGLFRTPFRSMLP